MATWKCPGCGGLLSAPDSKTALRLRCTQCGRVFQTEAPAPAAPEPGMAGSAPSSRGTARGLPKSAIAIMVFCGCAVLGVALYAFVFSPPPRFPEPGQSSQSPKERPNAADAAGKTPPGPAIATASPNGGTVATETPTAPRVDPAPAPGESEPPPATKPAPDPVPAKPTLPAKPPGETVTAKPPTRPPPAEPTVPKPEPTKPQPTTQLAIDDPLVQVVSDLYVGRMEQATAKLAALKGEESDALYQLVAGYRHTRLSEISEALAAFKAAVEADPRLSEAYLYLGAMYAVGGRGPQALESLEKGKVLASGDARFGFVEGLTHFRTRDWEKSKAAFDAAATSKDATLAAAAAERSQRVALIKGALEQLGAKKQEIEASLKENQDKLKKAKDEETKAEAKKEDLRKQYEKEKVDIERTYRNHIAQANRNYDRAMDYRSGSDYNRRTDARRQRDEELSRARREYESGLSKLDGSIKPKVLPLNTEINKLKNEVTKQTQTLAKARADVAKLRGEEAALLAPPRINLIEDVRALLPLTPSHMRDIVKGKKPSTSVATQ